MFCKNCGKELGAGDRFCTNCGFDNSKDVNAESNIEKNVSDFAKNIDKQFESSVNEIKIDINGGSAASSSDARPYKRRLRSDRGLIIYIILSILTCGIYGYYFIYTVAKDINTACEGDGEVTGGLASFIIFSFLTCGIYGLYWQYKIGNRIQANAGRYGLIITENGTSILLWEIFGMLLCFIGSYVGPYILIKNTNIICAAYNQKNNL